MKFIKNFILILLFIFPISNSFGAMVTHNQTEGLPASSSGIVAGIEFNNDGTKMFISYAQPSNGYGNPHYIQEYNLSTPYDISTRVYAGDGERCELTGTETGSGYQIYDLDFSSDGMKFFIVSRHAGGDGRHPLGDRVYGFDLTSPYDVSTCALATKQEALDTTALTNGSNAGDFDHTTHNDKHRVQSLEINDDGTKLFLTFMDANDSDVGARLYEYNLSTPYDVSTLSIVTTAGIELPATINGAINPAGMRFSANGKRIFIISHNNTNAGIVQISLDKAYDTSSFTIDGGLNLFSGISPANKEPRGVAFSASGLKLYIGRDSNDPEIENVGVDEIMEYDLVCPFTIIVGKCPPVTENSVRTGIAIAQIEVATRTIEHSTDTALNRLKWIRRNKDNQNLTNLNLDLNFTNQMLASLTKVVKTSATTKKKEEKQQDVFYWSEGSIAVGRVGDTNVSSFKKIKTDAITVGADKFTRNNGIRGLAFRFGKNDIDVGSAGSNLDTNTYNLTHYTSSPIEDDTKFIDTVFGVGVLNSDILSVLDGKRSTAERNGKQIYGTIKLKDEIKKNNLILVPSAQIDLGYTRLDSYQESGNTAMKFKKQGIQSRNARLSIAAIDELENEKYTIRKHGKLEYKANLRRSSNIKYSYVSDATSGEFDTKLNSGALHNLNGELGIDIILPDSFSIFLIYERNQALGTGHTDKIHLAIGYLPNRKTNYAFKLVGSENLGSEFKISKNINDFEIDFRLNNQDVLRPNTFDEATINLKKIF
ncbi:autotransporter outer membrane beta-barrel domain-containing protein [Candidatus Pelagibacter ubique]|nr:autotransporter outer membrane beta-barrel domain-containing protein [Candidatus Pelagibacter ubique]